MTTRLSKLEPAPTDAVVDIVFVHGLEGGPESTWTRDEVFWPRHLLPNDFPKARIFTFGYGTEPLGSRGGSLWDWITTSADELCRHLLWQRSQDDLDEALPIVFVAYSLGGLALLMDRKQQFASNVRSIAFFGTPFQKFEMVQWTKLAIDLDGESTELSKLGQDFADLVAKRNNDSNKLQLHRFFEANNMKNGPVVPEITTRVGNCPGDGIPSDHWNICRFGRGDQNYQKVSRVFQRWAREFENMPETSEVYSSVLVMHSFR
ncbi:hypothetical protein B0T10DRAFT_581738 [Thelonectria olida]|uniref:Uncharacterized protein n=1 Tax=Thelonectria olida TaxID=1576542 RepID=A0A9P9AHL7_9HYPO|nr:hypothetical protein B0T10DRAFT_581738 [Thelonectria olida]